MTTVVLNTVTRKVEVFSSARDVQARAEIADHKAAADPHPQYLGDADLAEVALSGDAGDLTAGTVPDARMPNWTGYNVASRTALEAANIQPAVDAVRINGFTSAGDGGGARYKRAASEPSHEGKIRSADGAWWELAENRPLPQMFGALADASNDDATALRNAITYARQKKTPVFFPEGRYRTTQALTQAGQTGGFEVYGPRAVILHDFAAAIGPALFQAGGGSIGSSLAVTANIIAGDTQLTIADASSLSAGDYIALRDQAQPHYGTSTDEQVGVEGEVLVVESVDSATQITVRGAVEEDYTLVDDATWTNDNIDVRKLTLVEDIIIRDIGFEDVSSTGSNVARVFQMNHTLGMRIENVTMKNFASDGVRSEFAVDFRISNVRFENFAIDGGYGVQVRKGCSGIVDRCVMRTGRHLFTTGDGSDDIPPRNVDIVDCEAYGQTAAAFDTHGNGKNIRFINCRDHSHRSDAGTGDASFQIRCKNASVINPMVTGGGHEFGVAAYAGAENFLLRGGEIRDCDTSVQLQWCENPSVRGVRIYPKAGATNAVTVARLGTYNVPMDHCDIGDLDIIGDASSPAVNGVNYATWLDDFTLGEIRTRNVTNRIVGSDALRIGDPKGTLTIADDGFATIDVAGAHGLSSGLLMLWSDGASAFTAPNGIVRFRAGNTPSIQIIAFPDTTNLTFTTGALTGTTGTDGKITISAHTDSKIYIENRRGSPVPISYAAMWK